MTIYTQLCLHFTKQTPCQPQWTSNFPAYSPSVPNPSLRHVLCRCEILPQIAHFLTGRRQRVQYKSALSELKTLSCSVPQGTKLGPITFIAVINSASEDSAIKSFKYIDDLSLGAVRLANQHCQIGRDVHDLDAWAKDNCLTLNPSKCKVMQVCLKKKKKKKKRFL